MRNWNFWRACSRLAGAQLGVRQDEITEESTWTQLGLTPLTAWNVTHHRGGIKLEIPHSVGERLDTVGKTVDHLLTLIAVRRGDFQYPNRSSDHEPAVV